MCMHQQTTLLKDNCGTLCLCYSLIFILPWCFIGDLNSILGAHEHRGQFTPARIPMEECHSWTNSTNLLHLPTRGAEFTWSNRRGGGIHTERRLDIAICNKS
jgi:hypothetical protein